eukprot:1414843-Lingulodinium_polyedra.AAC.1
MPRPVLLHPQCSLCLLRTVFAGAHVLMQALPGLLQLGRHEVPDAKDDALHGHGPPRPGRVLAVHD